MNWIFPICSLLILLATSCEKEKMKFDYTGRTENAFLRPVKGAVINITAPGNSTVVATATSDRIGGFTMNFEEGTYDVTVKAAGYADLVQSLTFTASTSSDFKLTGTANISGNVLDSQTGGGRSGAKVYFSLETNELSTSVFDFSTTTTATGTYSIAGAPTGAVKGLIETDFYFSRSFTATINSGTTVIPPAIAVRKVVSPQYRIVTYWTIPSPLTELDLDIHLTGPISGGGRFHCYYGSLNPNSTVSLDLRSESIAITANKFMEIMTVNSFVTGTYRFSVFNWGDIGPGGALGISTAKGAVEIYDFNGLKNTINIGTPSGTAGNSWRVFEFTVAAGVPTVVPKNTFYNVTNDADINQFRSGRDKIGRYRESDF